MPVPIEFFSLRDVMAQADQAKAMRTQEQMNRMKMQEYMSAQQGEQSLRDMMLRSITTTGGSPAIPGIPATQGTGGSGDYDVPPTDAMPEVAAVPEVPGRTDFNYDKMFELYKNLPEAIRAKVDPLKLHSLRAAEEDRRMAMAVKLQQMKGTDPYEGPVLFDTEGNTFRATKNGKIVPIQVEGGARIAPPVYPYQFTPPGGGPPQQGVITKPQAARMAEGGPVSLGMTEAQGKQNIENRTKYLKNVTGLEKTESTLGALDRFISEKGTQPGLGPINAVDRRTAQTLHANVLAGLREIDDMGVLQPGELPFLERQIADPGSLMNFGQADAIRAQIQTVRNRIKALKPILEKQFGQQTAAGQPQKNSWEDGQYLYRRNQDGSVDRKLK